MALECIHYRKFTHQSDVWSYGKAEQKARLDTVMGNMSGALHICMVSVVFVDLIIKMNMLQIVK